MNWENAECNANSAAIRSTTRLGVLVLMAALGLASPSARGQATLTCLASFSGSSAPDPMGSLLRDSAGDLIGTTEFGGANGDGTVFEFTSTGTLSNLVNFNGLNGENPMGGLIAGSDGDLYGTTVGGGLYGFGSVFSLAPDGTLTSWSPYPGFGGAYGPAGALATDAAGNLYGTTGPNASTPGSAALGCVFMLTPSGTFIQLAAFNGTNGRTPFSGVIRDAAGNLYGTTIYGGSSELGSGNVFKLTPGGTLSSLFTFNPSTDCDPLGGLVADAAGNLYGTTSVNLGGHDRGSIYKISPAGVFTTLATFNGSNGAAPSASMIMDDAGDLFGTTDVGGNLSLNGGNGEGTVFELTSGGTLVTLASFNGTDGDDPCCDGLTADANGDLYGTTIAGGANGDGTIFELTNTGFVVPEPATLALIGFASVGLLVRRRRA
jgi:uncharacterized repeat protein (TIGR03803 family)